VTGITDHPAIKAQWHEAAYIYIRTLAYGMLGHWVVAKISIVAARAYCYGVKLQIRYFCLVTGSAGAAVRVVMGILLLGPCTG